MVPTSSAMLEATGDPPFDGLPEWRVTRTLPEGVEVTIRPITPDDREELARGFAAMSPRSRYLRFMGLATELSDAALTYLTSVDQQDHVALVATVPSPDLKTERGIGVARFIRVADDRDARGAAEAAIAVIDEWQRRGVGAALAIELARAARVRGLRTIRAEVLADNDAMIAILEAAGARRVERGEDGGTLFYDIAIEPEPFGDRIRRVLRGAAETLGVTSRLLRVPSSSF